MLGALWWLLLEDVQRPWRGLQRRSRLSHLGLRGRVRRDLGRRTGRMIVIDRGRVVAPKAQLLLHSWKKVHVPFTILLTVVAAAHIWISWGRAF